jgi:hypothetical protein
MAVRQYSNGLNGIERKRAECVLLWHQASRIQFLDSAQLLRRNNSSCAPCAPDSNTHVQALACHQSASYLLEVLDSTLRGAK